MLRFRTSTLCSDLASWSLSGCVAPKLFLDYPVSARRIQNSTAQTPTGSQQQLLEGFRLAGQCGNKVIVGGEIRKIILHASVILSHFSIFWTLIPQNLDYYY